jgi:hypothetical protein
VHPPYPSLRRRPTGPRPPGGMAGWSVT